MTDTTHTRNIAPSHPLTGPPLIRYSATRPWLARATRMRFERLRRREFITLIGGAAAWPLTASAQPGERMRRIGMLVGGGEDDPDMRGRVGTMLEALAQLGWTEGRNVRIDTRWATGDIDKVRKEAATLAALKPDVIIAGGTSTIGPLVQATRTVPIVFVGVVDPVGSGVVGSLARPGVNATGFLHFEYGLTAKWLELLREIAPSTTRVAVLRNPAVTSGIGQFAIIQYVASS